MEISSLAICVLPELDRFSTGLDSRLVRPTTSQELVHVLSIPAFSHSTLSILKYMFVDRFLNLYFTRLSGNSAWTACCIVSYRSVCTLVRLINTTVFQRVLCKSLYLEQILARLVLPLLLWNYLWQESKSKRQSRELVCLGPVILPTETLVPT